MGREVLEFTGSLRRVFHDSGKNKYAENDVFVSHIWKRFHRQYSIKKSPSQDVFLIDNISAIRKLPKSCGLGKSF